MTESPRLRSATGGFPLTEAHLFHLVDVSEGVQSGSSPDVPGDRLFTTGSGAVLARFASAVEDNEPRVDIEHWSAEPPGPGDGWQGESGELTVEGGRLSLASGISGIPADGLAKDFTVPPGRYRVAVWCRGRQETVAAWPDCIEAGELPRGTERWLIRLWPAS
ncbi:hypothetical protein [Streptomyces sp. NPDC020917]|uniref:hypothetical protein n=1 Tax=Streptomyces sp. NPDC020917 TaxID=3365102 RepID=UPI0037992C1B